MKIIFKVINKNNFDYVNYVNNLEDDLNLLKSFLLGNITLQSQIESKIIVPFDLSPD